MLYANITIYHRMEHRETEILDRLNARVKALQDELDAVRAELESLKVNMPLGGAVDEVFPEPVDISFDEEPVADVPQVEADAVEPEQPQAEAVVNEAPAPVEEKPKRERPAVAWRVDIPGAPVSNIISGISLNDRVLFINTLFKEDPMLFQSTINAFNMMGSFDEAEDYVVDRFPDWNLKSDIVYRLMMAIRRKLK